MISLPFMIISAVAAYGKLKKFSVPPIFGTGIFIIFCLYATSVIYSYKLLNINWENQVNYVIEHRQEETIYLPPMPPLTPTQEILQKMQGFDCPASSIKYFGGLNANKFGCINLLIAQYYGAKYIVAENRD